MSSSITFHHGLRAPYHKPVIYHIERASVFCKGSPVEVHEPPRHCELAGVLSTPLVGYFLTMKLPAMKNESKWSILLLLEKLLTQGVHFVAVIAVIIPNTPLLYALGEQSP